MLHNGNAISSLENVSHLRASVSQTSNFRTAFRAAHRRSTSRDGVWASGAPLEGSAAEGCIMEMQRRIDELVTYQLIFEWQIMTKLLLVK